ncbi:MAG: hypothetical protein JKX86_01690, partial [Verrucomicrobiales bacterium]|nr:hypothetical protein [Verrucomicrobiales bacterium]
FAHEAFKPKGGPCGGDGGKGGDVILQADHDINNLIAQFYAPHLHAKDGRPGEGKGKTGRGGKKLIVKVPCGTMVWKLPPPEPTAEERDVPLRPRLAKRRRWRSILKPCRRSRPGPCRRSRKSSPT